MQYQLTPSQQHELELLVTQVRDLLSPLDSPEARLDALRRADSVLTVTDELNIIKRRYGGH